MEFDAKRFIRETKFELLRRFDVAKAFVKSRDMMLREVEAIRTRHDAELTVIPQVEYHEIVKGAVEEPFRDLVRRRGCVIVKGVFDRIQVSEWNHEIGEYIDRNDYLTAANKKKIWTNISAGLKTPPHRFLVFTGRAHKLWQGRRRVWQLRSVSSIGFIIFLVPWVPNSILRTILLMPIAFVAVSQETQRLASHHIWTADPMKDGVIQPIRLYTVLFTKEISKASTHGRLLFALKHANMHRLPFARCFVHFRDGLH